MSEYPKSAQMFANGGVRYNPIQLVYIAEIFPMALRSRATASKSAV